MVFLGSPASKENPNKIPVVSISDSFYGRRRSGCAVVWRENSSKIRGQGPEKSRTSKADRRSQVAQES